MGDAQSSDRSVIRRAPARSLARMPTASGAILRLTAARIRDAGQDVEALLKVNALASLVLDDRAARLGAEAQIRILDAASKALKDDWLGRSRQPIARHFCSTACSETLMKITALETIRLEEFGNLLWVRVHTDEGLVGLGETFLGAAGRRGLPARVGRAAAARAGPARRSRRVNAEPRRLSRLRAPPAPRRAAIRRSTSRSGTSSARRSGSRSAQRWAAPPRPIRIYNTCAGYHYVRDAQGAEPCQLGHVGEQGGALRGPRRLPARADELAASACSSRASPA